MPTNITLESKLDVDSIKYTSYTLVRLRDCTPCLDKDKTFFVTMMQNESNSKPIYQQYEIATSELVSPGLKEGEIPLKMKDGNVCIIVTTMQPSFSLFVGLFCREDTNLPKIGPQIYLSWKRLKNGWPVSCRNNRLLATYGERVNKSGWSGEDLPPSTPSFPLLRKKFCQYNPNEKGFEQLHFESEVASELKRFNDFKDSEKNTDNEMILQVRKKHIDLLFDLMPTIDQVLEDHNLWETQGTVLTRDLELFLDHEPNVPGFIDLFIP
jgi:hypothetical protein